MNFNLIRHIRLASCVAIWVGALLHNWGVILLGVSVMTFGYMRSIDKIERYLESQTEEKEHARDN